MPSFTLGKPQHVYQRLLGIVSRETAAEMLPPQYCALINDASFDKCFPLYDVRVL